MTDAPVIISDPFEDRYASQNLIDWWDQDRLREASVLVVGAGALGNEVIKNLVLSGIGKIILVDMDRVELTNLSRAALLRPDDVGKSKVHAVAHRAAEMNPDVKVVPIEGNVLKHVGLGVFRRVDVVLGCLDNREARMAVNRFCWRTGRPFVDGGLGVLDGSVKVFLPPDGPCYECGLTHRDYEFLNVRYSCPPNVRVIAGRYPTTITSASVIGAIQVQETLKLIHGRPAAAGEACYYAGQTLRMRRLTLPRRADCPVHDPMEDIETVACSHNSNVAQLLGHLSDQPTIIVREPLVIELVCPSCGRRAPCYRPAEAVVTGKCPVCGADTNPRLGFAVPLTDETAQILLSELGIPPLDIVRVRTATGVHSLELSSDRIV